MKKWRCFMYALALPATIALVWSTVGGFEYIRLDDNLYTTEYPLVAGGLTWAGIKGVFTNFTQGGIWMPLTSVSYMLDISLFGSGPGPHHCMSVVYHMANALLFFALLLRLLPQSERGEPRHACFAAFVGTLLWAIHPQRCESVSWIASRKDTIFTLFVLLGLHAWLSAASSRKCLWASYALMALGCLGKPTAMVFPAVAFCVRPDRNWKRYVLPLLLSVGTALLAVHSQTNPTGDAQMMSRGLNEGYGSLAWRSLNATVATGLYFAQLVVPRGIHVLYQRNVGAMPNGAALGLAVFSAVALGFSLAIWRLRKNAEATNVLWRAGLWFAAAIGPTLGVAGGFGFHARADRFLYLPMMAVSWVLAWAFARANVRGWCKATVLLVLAVYAFAAFENSNTYREDFTLFSQVLKFEPTNIPAMTHVAAECCAKYNQPDKGIELYRKALSLEPEDDETRELLAFALSVRARPGDDDEIVALCEPLVARPELDTRGKATSALGAAAMRRRDWADAIRFLKQAMRGTAVRDCAEDNAMRLAMCYYNIRRYDEAKPILTKLAGSGRPEVRTKARELLGYIWTRETR